MSNRFTTTAIFQAETEGGYTVTVPALPGVVSYGASIEEAEANIIEAIQLHLENLRAHDQSVEQPSQRIFTSLLNVELS
jgi:antitoxin HicB